MNEKHKEGKQRVEPVTETPVPPEVQLYAPKKPDPAMAAFDAELGKVQADLNEAAAKAEPPKPERKPYPFVALARKVSEGMVQAAEQALNEAQSNLEAAKLHAAKLEQEIVERDKQIGDLTERLNEFGKGILSAHQTFHNGDKK